MGCCAMSNCISLRSIISKSMRETYRMMHPCLWGKRLQINGVPTITDLKNVEFGTDVSVNSGVYIQSSAKVLIGDKVTLSRDVCIFTEGLDITNYADNIQNRFRDHVAKQVVIETGVWIAAGAIICPGVTIAADSVIAAGAVVSSNLTDEGFLYGGVPAKKLRRLIL